MRLAWTLVLLSAGVSAWAGDLLPLSSAEFCGRCHRAILDAWKR